MSFDFLTTTSTLIISLGLVSDYIEKRFQKHLRFPPSGIYKYGDTMPTLQDGGVYFVKSTSDPNKNYQLTDINLLVAGDFVVSQTGTILLTSTDVINKDTYLSNMPMVPTTGFEIAKLCVESYIAKSNQFSSEFRNYKNSIYGYFINNNHDAVDDVIFNDCMESIYKTIDMFVGNDINHIYFYRRSSISDLIVEKTIDWRAYQWMLQNSKVHDVNNDI